MNAPARNPVPILRTISGEPPLGINGMAFRDDQGEIFEHDNPRYRTNGSRVGLLELETGKWLAHPPGFLVHARQFESREHALRCAIAAVIRKARKCMRAKEGEGTHWSEGQGGRVIEWALSLKPSRKADLVQAASADVEAECDHPVGEVATEDADRVIEESASGEAGSLKQPSDTDPIVRSLVEAHRARKEFPAAHTFSMTNPTISGSIKTVGTCTCSHVFVFPGGDHERMDAAIEAHLQKFDHLPEKIDGRGHPIGADNNRAEPGNAEKPKRQRKRNQPDAPEGILASSVAGAVVPTALRLAPAPSTPPDGAGLSFDDDDDALLRAAEALAWREPPTVSDTLKGLLDFSKVYAVGSPVTRPLLRWHGGKWKLAPWVMGFFPEHRIYVEPFGGAGSVLMRKPRVYAEIYNDLDDVVVNLFRVLRDDAKAARLINALHLTPFGREEFTDALLEAEDDVERARHLIVRSYMGFGSNAHSGSAVAEKTGFKSFTRPDEYRSTGFRANSNRSGTTPAHDWANYPAALPAIIERLSAVIVEHRPAIDVMRQHDGATTLHYVDPPYLPETRSPANKYDLKHRMYRHELTVEDHQELLAFLRTLQGFVVLSGYPSPMYDEALPNWRRETCAALADGARERTEVLWINPACAAALDQQHPTLFNISALDVANTPPPPHGLGHDGR